MNYEEEEEIFDIGTATFTRYVNRNMYGRPTAVTVRVVQTWLGRVHELEAARNVANCIVSGVYVVVKAYKRWSIDEINQRVVGWLSATNIVNGTLKVYEKKITDLSALFDGTACEAILLNIQQSNVDIYLTDLEWTFSIDPRSFIAGSGGNFRKPSWAPKRKFARTWEEHSDIACAAYAIKYLLQGQERDYNHYPERAIEDAKELMTVMGWNVEVSMTEISRFVVKFPEYRLSVFTPQTIGRFVMTWEGERYDGSLENALYLVFVGTLGETGHFAATKAPAEILKAANKKPYIRFCHTCVEAYNSTSDHNCTTGGRSHKAKRPKKTPCPKGCGDFGPKHDCARVQCRWCPELKYERESGWEHRCILYKEAKEKTFETGDGDGKNPNLWAYDLEARVEIQETNVKRIVDFNFDPDDPTAFIDSAYSCDVAIFDYKQAVQKANMVVAKNIFTNELKVFEGDSCIETFLMFITCYNKGNNILIAHNGSGYDTRLIYDAAVKLTSKVKIHSVCRGTKFMELQVEKCIFRDSLLHVKGSIKSLSKSFCPGHLRKGYFPHLFNTSENYDQDYQGRIPDKKYFDLSMSCRSEDDLREFNEWHDTWVRLYNENIQLPDTENPGLWNFRKEMRLYCINDVECLAMIAKGYHEAAFEKFKMSPWFNATAPSYVHEMILTKLSFELELEEVEELYRNEHVVDLAKNKFWAVLKPNEYWFARRALRGGRTEIKQVYKKISDEEWSRGVRIRYQDICSEYPYNQIVNKYPVGLPLVC